VAQAASGPAPGQVTIVTPGGSAVVISDLQGQSGVSMTAPGGARISVLGAEIRIDNGHGAAITLTGNQVRITGILS
jgi:hypothetical protein